MSKDQSNLFECLPQDIFISMLAILGFKGIGRLMLTSKWFRDKIIKIINTYQNVDLFRLKFDSQETFFFEKISELHKLSFNDKKPLGLLPDMLIKYNKDNIPLVLEYKENTHDKFIKQEALRNSPYFLHIKSYDNKLLEFLKDDNKQKKILGIFLVILGSMPNKEASIFSDSERQKAIQVLQYRKTVGVYFRNIIFGNPNELQSYNPNDIDKTKIEQLSNIREAFITELLKNRSIVEFAFIQCKNEHYDPFVFQAIMDSMIKLPNIFSVRFDGSTLEDNAVSAIVYYFQETELMRLKTFAIPDIKLRHILRDNPHPIKNIFAALKEKKTIEYLDISNQDAFIRDNFCDIKSSMETCKIKYFIARNLYKLLNLHKLYDPFPSLLTLLEILKIQSIEFVDLTGNEYSQGQIQSIIAATSFNPNLRKVYLSYHFTVVFNKTPRDREGFLDKVSKTLARHPLIVWFDEYMNQDLTNELKQAREKFKTSTCDSALNR